MHYILLIIFFITASCRAAAPFDAGGPQDLFINNRVLLKVNGKTITVLDVVHKMDLIFYRQFAELAASPIARYQFYLASWKGILSTVIDDQLILADAKEKQVEVTGGEIREELEKLFGPDVVINVHKMNMTYDEVWDMLKTELTVQRMIGMMVHMQAQADINPKRIRERYEKMLAENPPKASWVYQMLTCRGPGSERVANKGYELLRQDPSVWEELPLRLAEQGIQVTLSDEYKRTEGELSLAHKAILQTLATGAFSAPIIQANDVCRIFCVKNYSEAKAPTLQEMEDEVRGILIQEALAKHNKNYREKLRKNYGLSQKELSQLLPDEGELFVLR